jgi:Ca2+-binding RTX toxin-like protein
MRKGVLLTLFAIAALAAPVTASAGTICLGRTATIVGTESPDMLTGTTGPDVIVGLGGEDIIQGLGGKDVICAGEENDTVNAGPGDDYVLASGGDDQLDGGLGRNFIWFLGAPGPVDARLTTGVADGWGHDTLTSFTGIIGSNFADHLVGRPLAAAQDAMLEQIEGRGGNDEIVGTGARDFLIGGGGNDDIAGVGGNDDILGSAGRDTLEAGAGHDYLVGGSGNDVQKGGTGYDYAFYDDSPGGVRVNLEQGVASGFGSDRLSLVEGVVGSRHADVLRGNGRSNGLYGLAGADKLYGLGSSDGLYGGAGPDRLEGGTGNDLGNGGAGRDSCLSIERPTSCP